MMSWDPQHLHWLLPLHSDSTERSFAITEAGKESLAATALLLISRKSKRKESNAWIMNKTGSQKYPYHFVTPISSLLISGTPACMRAKTPGQNSSLSRDVLGILHRQIPVHVGQQPTTDGAPYSNLLEYILRDISQYLCFLFAV